ncbi:MAG TPA: iron-sulfur cluster assembly accessory protein [Candidatus Saccharimonadales bacterium]|nr:iron-sulfur cluster assembly accessory protein [Candidatus Saccharimonadales bacterium]
MIALSPAAVARLKELLVREERQGQGVRLGVEGGGCSGMNYRMAFGHQEPGDEVFEFEGLKLYVDSRSYAYLAGTEVDYAGGLLGAGFKFRNPNARRSCGCGESFAL